MCVCQCVRVCVCVCVCDPNGEFAHRKFGLLSLETPDFRAESVFQQIVAYIHIYILIMQCLPIIQVAARRLQELT